MIRLRQSGEQEAVLDEQDLTVEVHECTVGAPSREPQPHLVPPPRTRARQAERWLVCVKWRSL